MKNYPATLKNAHDVEFRRNRILNNIDDAFYSDNSMTVEQIDQAEKLADRLEKLLLALMNSRDGKVAYITGEQIGLYKETMLWASVNRK